MATNLIASHNLTNATTANTTTSSNLNLTSSSSSSFNSSSISGVNSTSVQCQQASDGYMTCIQGLKNNATTANNTDPQNCDSCSSEYDGLVNSCQDRDYQKSSVLLGFALTCHKENGQYCSSQQNFQCDACGKYTANKIYFNGYIDTLADQSKAAIQQCATAKSSANIKGLTLGLLMIASFL